MVIVLLQGGAEVMLAAAILFVDKIEVIDSSRIKCRLQRILSWRGNGPRGEAGVKISVIGRIDLQVLVCKDGLDFTEDILHGGTGL
jgi:hypothetical protein